MILFGSQGLSKPPQQPPKKRTSALSADIDCGIAFFSFSTFIHVCIYHEKFLTENKCIQRFFS